MISRRAFIGGAAATTALLPLRGEATATPLRYPHESVAWSTAGADTAYTLQIQGAGLPLLSLNLTAERALTFEWVTASATHVALNVRAPIHSSKLIAVGAPIPKGVGTTLQFRIVGGNINAAWRTASVTPRVGYVSCLVTTGRDVNFTWLPAALASSTDPLVDSMLFDAVSYYQMNRVMFAKWAAKIGVIYEYRPSMLFISTNRVKTWKDVLQETRAFMGVPSIDPITHAPIMADDMPSAAQQYMRWRAFMVASTIQAGIHEAYSQHLATGLGAISAPVALVEGTMQDSSNFAILTRPGDTTKIKGYNTATINMIESALAAPSTQVHVSRYPITVEGWTGTPWIAYQVTASGTITNAGTFLNTLRGAIGNAGAMTAGSKAHADAIASAKTTQNTGLALANAGLGFFGLSAAFPGLAVPGIALGYLGLAIGFYGLYLEYKVEQQTLTTPKTGHVDIDATAGGPSVASTGPGDGGSGPSGTSGEGSCCGVGANGNSPSGGVSGPGGDGDAPGDVGEL